MTEGDSSLLNVELGPWFYGGVPGMQIHRCGRFTSDGYGYYKAAALDGLASSTYLKLD